MKIGRGRMGSGAVSAVKRGHLLPLVSIGGEGEELFDLDYFEPRVNIACEVGMVRVEFRFYWQWRHGYLGSIQ